MEPYPAVAIVLREGRKFILRNGSENSIDTQEVALEYYEEYGFKHVPDEWDRVSDNTLLIKYYEGEPLSNFKDSYSVSTDWWYNVLTAIYEYTKAMAEHKACHNDLKAGNIIVTGDEIVVIDHEFFTFEGWVPDMVREATRNEKISLGWSVRYRVGSDLNKLLGELSEFKSCPLKVKRWIEARVMKDPQKRRYYS